MSGSILELKWNLDKYGLKVALTKDCNAIWHMQLFRENIFVKKTLLFVENKTNLQSTISFRPYIIKYPPCVLPDVSPSASNPGFFLGRHQRYWMGCVRPIFLVLYNIKDGRLYLPRCPSASPHVSKTSPTKRKIVL